MCGSGRGADIPLNWHRGRIGVLAAAMKDADPKPRRAAAEALGDIGPAAKASVPALIQALTDTDPDVQFAGWS